MGKLPRMSAAQFRRVKQLIRRLCANCDGDNCLLLDSGELCPCPQLLSYSLLCTYFRDAVLPNDETLYAAIMQGGVRRCKGCGQPFTAAKQNALYCRACAAKRIRHSKRAWAARNRAEHRKTAAPNT